MQTKHLKMEPNTKPKPIFSIDRKLVKSRERLKSIADGYHAQECICILVQGVFDLLHLGHIKYLELAKSQGGNTKLFVGVDDDAMAKKNKDDDRPYDPLSERLAVVAGLESVDHVIARSIDEPNTSVAEIIKPDIMIISSSSTQYVKEGDTETFEEQMRREYQTPGFVTEIVILEPQSSNSTTAKILKFKKSGKKDGAKELADAIVALAEEYKRNLEANG